MPKTQTATATEQDRRLAAELGARVKAARLRAGLTQREVAGDRYTKAYVSALEHGHLRPSMPALAYVAEKLGTTASALLADAGVVTAADKLEADLRLAAGDWQSALDAYVNLLERQPTAEQRASILLGVAEARYRLGQAAETITAAAEAEAWYLRGGRIREVLMARYWLSAGHHASDNPGHAKELLDSILAAIRDGAPAEPDLRLRVLIALGAVEANAGEHRTALTYLEEARGFAADLDDRRRATFLYALSTNYREAGDHEAALRTGLESLGLFRAAEAEAEANNIANELALAYLATGNVRRARSFASEALTGAERIGDRWLLANVLDTAAQVELAGGDHVEATRLVERALEGAEASGNRKAKLGALRTRAHILRATGDSAAAITALEGAVELAAAEPVRTRWRELVAELADLLAADGQHERAFALTREALRG